MERKSVTFDTESFGDVGRHVWDVALGDVIFCGEIQAFAKFGHAAGER